MTQLVCKCGHPELESVVHRVNGGCYSKGGDQPPQKIPVSETLWSEKETSQRPDPNVTQ